MRLGPQGRLDTVLEGRSAEADRPTAPSAGTRIAIVANRGPVDLVWDEERWVSRASSGGLVSMLAPLGCRPDVAWFFCVSEPPEAQGVHGGLNSIARGPLCSAPRLNPIGLPERTYHDYYGRTSNEVLWMLQHRLIGQGGFLQVDSRCRSAWDHGYLEANRLLADSIATACPEAEAFLVQDYHLYPLPALLRRRLPGRRILHFTHIPFPEASLLKLLPRPWRDSILQGLLGADVVGLQTTADADAFLGCCAELLAGRVVVQGTRLRTDDGRTVAVRAYPASVDPEDLMHTMASDAVSAARQRLAARIGQSSIVRVDRLDPSKNQRIGFLAFERLLELRPDLRGKVRFSAFLVPSRTDLSVYCAYRDAIYRLVREINNRFSAQCGGPPIQVFYANDREQALAAMEACDVLLVNSLRDGMNLVAKEWALVSRRPGVLVASETAGVAQEAAGSALLICPLDVDGTAEAMIEALDMPGAERLARLSAFRARIGSWTARRWLSAQLEDLEVDLG